MNQFYILMADVIDSRDHPDQVMMMNQLKGISATINEIFQQDLLSPLTVTVGDEFQGIARSKKSLFRLIFAIEEHLFIQKTGLSLRYSLQNGEIVTPLNTENAYGMYGDGLTVAHEKLETLKNEKRRFHIDLGSSDSNYHLVRLMDLYDSFKSEWKSAQTEVISTYLEKPDYKYLTEKNLYKNWSGAWKIVRSLKLDEYLTTKELVFHTLNILA